MRLIYGSFLFSTLAFLSNAKASQYQLDLSVLRDGNVIMAPSVVIEEGKKADLSASTEGNPESMVRLLVSVTPEQEKKNGKDIVNVTIMFFESINGELVLCGEPSISGYAGTEASMAPGSKGLKRAASDYEIRLRVNKFSA